MHLFSLAVVLIPGASGFALTSHRAVTSREQTTTSLAAIRCEEKTYQLEELEDSRGCTSELFLHDDRTVHFGHTDGPPFEGAAGRWEIEPGTDNFKMCIQRRYKTGREGTDMGEFVFDIWRTFTGEMKMVGESVAINGKIRDGNADNFEGEIEVGFFNMIDGTDEMMSYAEKAGELRSS